MPPRHTIRGWVLTRCDADGENEEQQRRGVGLFLVIEKWWRRSVDGCRGERNSNQEDGVQLSNWEGRRRKGRKMSGEGNKRRSFEVEAGFNGGGRWKVEGRRIKRFTSIKSTYSGISQTIRRVPVLYFCTGVP